MNSSKIQKEANHFYKVSKDENIGQIAQKTGIHFMKILLYNNITPFMLKENMVIFIC